MPVDSIDANLVLHRRPKLPRRDVERLRHHAVLRIVREEGAGQKHIAVVQTPADQEYIETATQFQYSRTIRRELSSKSSGLRWHHKQQSRSPFELRAVRDAESPARACRGGKPVLGACPSLVDTRRSVDHGDVVMATDIADRIRRVDPEPEVFRLSALLGPSNVNSGAGIALGASPFWRAPSAWCLVFATRPTSERSVAIGRTHEACSAPRGNHSHVAKRWVLSNAAAVPIVGCNGAMPVEPRGCPG